MKKTLYICGDSFCVTDPEYGISWTEMLQEQCPSLEIKNFSSIGASNYLIYLQVKEALEQNCDYLIYNATSSIRQEFLLNNDHAIRDSVDRYWRHDRPGGALRCNSYHNIEKNVDGIFTDNHRQIIKNFFTSFFDLPSQIEKNYVFISHTLNLLSAHAHVTDWAWSRGGFEHKNFLNSQPSWNFDAYVNRECDINLWDHYQPNVYRPYYHVTNFDIMQSVCDSYKKMLKL